MLIMITVNK